MNPSALAYDVTQPTKTARQCLTIFHEMVRRGLCTAEEQFTLFTFLIGFGSASTRLKLRFPEHIGNPGAYCRKLLENGDWRDRIDEETYSRTDRLMDWIEAQQPQPDPAPAHAP